MKNTGVWDHSLGVGTVLVHWSTFVMHRTINRTGNNDASVQTSINEAMVIRLHKIVRCHVERCAIFACWRGMLSMLVNV